MIKCYGISEEKGIAFSLMINEEFSGVVWIDGNLN